MRQLLSRTLSGLVHALADERPSAPFLVDGGRRWTRDQFRREMMAVANGLHALGVRAGDKVAVLMGNRAEWLLTVFAAASLGAVAVALNTWWKSRELRYALATADVKVLAMVDRYLGNDYVAALGDVAALKAEVPTLEAIVNIGDPRPHYVPFANLRQLGASADAAGVKEAIAGAAEDRIGYLLFTSGSTAHPKAVPVIQGRMLANGFEIGIRMGFTEAERTLIPVSLFWSYACMNALLTTITHGGTVILQDRFDAGAVLALIEAERCSALYATPNMGLALLQHPERKTRNLESLRTGSGRPASAKLLFELGAREACTIYALTECGIATVSDYRLPAEQRFASSGTPLPGMELEIVDPVSRAVLPRNTSGEVRIRSHMIPGYYKDAAQTAQAFDADRWFYTGDLGYLDDAGGLHVSARLKEVIKTGGINVAPAEVEDMLVSCPGVAQAIVVGVPDVERSEIIAALIVAKPGETIDEAGLLRYCRAEGAAYKVPRIVRVVPAASVPLTDTGKVNKMAVKQLFEADSGKS